MNVLKKISEVISYTMSMGDKVNDFNIGFILDDTIIRKSPAEDADPIYINVVKKDGSVDTYVRSETNNMESNKKLEAARIWRKVEN